MVPAATPTEPTFFFLLLLLHSFINTQTDVFSPLPSGKEETADNDTTLTFVLTEAPIGGTLKEFVIKAKSLEEKQSWMADIVKSCENALKDKAHHQQQHHQGEAASVSSNSFSGIVVPVAENEDPNKKDFRKSKLDKLWKKNKSKE